MKWGGGAIRHTLLGIYTKHSFGNLNEEFAIKEFTVQ
jgi:hypothetical protein